MPLPKPSKSQKKEDFLSTCMSDEKVSSEFPDSKQRYAVCNTQWQEAKGVKVSAAKFGAEFKVSIDSAAEYKGKNVELNKPFRLKGDKKKFGVYVKSKSGNVILVKFGDPNMSIKRDDPERRKSFRARHKCDIVEKNGDKTKPSYWSCKFWSSKPVSELVAEEEVDVASFSGEIIEDFDEDF